VVYRDAYHDDFRTRLDFDGVARFMRYYFKLVDTNGQVCFFNEYGFTGEPQKNGFFEHHYTNENEVIERRIGQRESSITRFFPTGSPAGSTKNPAILM
jgi:hypothetical protein